MRFVCWGQVSEHSHQPVSWNEIKVDEAADRSEIRKQVLQDDSLANLPELRLLSTRGAWHKWDRVDTLLADDLKIKVIFRSSGQCHVYNHANLWALELAIAYDILVVSA